MCRRMKPNKYESVMNITLAIVSATIAGYLLNHITDNSIISSGIVACIAITVDHILNFHFSIYEHLKSYFIKEDAR